MLMMIALVVYGLGAVRMFWEVSLARRSAGYRRTINREFANANDAELRRAERICVAATIALWPIVTLIDLAESTEATP